MRITRRGRLALTVLVTAVVALAAVLGEPLDALAAEYLDAERFSPTG